MSSISRKILEGDGQPGFDDPLRPLSFTVIFWFQNRRYQQGTSVKPLYKEPLGKVRKRAFLKVAAPILRRLGLSEPMINLKLSLIWNSGTVSITATATPKPRPSPQLQLSFA